MRTSYPVIGLKTATQEDIEQLKETYPQGFHKLYHSGSLKKLPCNGIFYTRVMKGGVYAR